MSSFSSHLYDCECFTLLPCRGNPKRRPSWRCPYAKYISNSNIVYILIFTTIEFCLVIDSLSQFSMADGYPETYARMQKAAGAFGFVAGLLGYYCTAHYLCEDALGFSVPMGNTDQWFERRRLRTTKDIEA